MAPVDHHAHAHMRRIALTPTASASAPRHRPADGQRDGPPWHVGALLAFLLLGILATWPLAGHALTAVPGFDSPITRAGMADQDQGLWAQWWVRDAIFVRHVNPLSTDLLYWPYYRGGLSLLLYDMQLLRVIVALPIQALLGLAAAYNFGVFLSFTIGGYIVGLKSPGRTIVEPGISAAIAVIIGLLLSGAFTLGNLLVGGLVPFLAGLLGGYLGERHQARGAIVSS